MEIVISLSATTADKSRTKLNSQESNTGHADLSEYTNLEKKLRLLKEDKEREKMTKEANPGDTVKDKKKAKPEKPAADDTGDSEDDDTSTDDAGSSDKDGSGGKPKPKKSGADDEADGDEFGDEDFGDEDFGDEDA
ncbi:hypothetical protein fHeYen902_130 [Yersinia phage fHe-Yen9-02]|nr:hypothetical protein fHeYen902_130 [Yersinia phage fHe-Yen9-02]